MSSRWNDLVEEARHQVSELAPEALAEEMRSSHAPVLLDVREADETRQGIIAGATWIPRGVLELRITQVAPALTTRIAVYCAGGTRSLLACRTLQQLGYQDVVSLGGGFTAWRAAGLPFVAPATEAPSPARYARHLRIPEVGEAGQARLRASKVLLVGAGGLGSPAALYLAAAGVGTLDVVDPDVVDVSNLQRQILHRTHDVGRPKARSAREHLFALNPEVRVNDHRTRLTGENVLELLGGHDVVVDGCDNFETRYRVSDACVHLGIPNVYASVHRFDGQATVFAPGHGPCYRCLFPEPLPARLAPTCEEAGVLGVLPGTMGLIQATEALKLLLGIGRPLVGRLLVYDALESSFREFRVERRGDCPACGQEGNPLRLLADSAVSSGCQRPPQA